MSKDMLGKKQVYQVFEDFFQSPEGLKGKQFKYIPPEILSVLQENFGFSIVNSYYYSPIPTAGEINSFFDSIGETKIYLINKELVVFLIKYFIILMKFLLMDELNREKIATISKMNISHILMQQLTIRL